MDQKTHPLRNFLDKIYIGAAYLASFFLLCILVVIVVQMVARWTGFVVMGAAAYAGYSMAASTFLAMAYTLHQDGHIRVRIILNKLGKNKKWGERWCYGIGSLLALYFFYYACRGTYFSYILNDISQQDDALPMWIPQMVMVIGTFILATAFIDRLYQTIFFNYEELEIKWKVKDEKAIDQVNDSKDKYYGE